MRANHIGCDYERRVEIFECPRCRGREAITEEEWGRVPVIGVKPALRCACGLGAHIPPSPATVEAHDQALAVADMLAALAGAPGPRHGADLCRDADCSWCAAEEPRPKTTKGQR